MELNNKAREILLDDENPEDEDDEETLELQLAALEAKLKLKRLQQSRNKALADDHKGSDSQGPPAAAGYVPTSQLTRKALHGRDRDHTPTRELRQDVEVPLSPITRSIQPKAQRSPGRVLLGIDKGIKGTDVSLRRARSSREALAHTSGKKGSSCRSSRHGVGQSIGSFDDRTHGRHHIKSFSERMAAGRLDDTTQANRREANHKIRSTGFKLEKGEVEKYNPVGEESRAREASRSLTKQRDVVSSGRDEILGANHLSPAGRDVPWKTHTLPDLHASPSSMTPNGVSSGISIDSPGGEDLSLYEPYSQIHLSSRVLPHSLLERTLPSETHTPLRIPHLLKAVTAPSFELPEDIVDYVVFGIIGSKSLPKNHKPNSKETNMRGSNDWEKQWDDGSQNDKKFMVLQLTDLTWSIDLYLFSTALPRYHRLSPGTVIAILNPGVMPPKRGKEDTGAFGLTLHSGEDTVLEIGMARDLGFCKAVKKDGKECGSWVNLAKTEYCEWHLNAQVTKTQAGRMGVNAGSNAFRLCGASSLRNTMPGGRMKGNKSGTQGLLPQKEGQKYDRNTGGQYFIASSSAGQHPRAAGAPVHRPGRSAADLLDISDDDPFLAEGQFSRDRDARLRQRLITEEKERHIARTLGAMEAGSAGGEYLRHRNGNDDAVSGGASQDRSQRSAETTKAHIIESTSKANNNGKRTSEGVRLSPVKKARIVTDRGLREAGRNTVGKALRRHDVEQDDDDLDIIGNHRHSAPQVFLKRSKQTCAGQE